MRLWTGLAGLMLTGCDALGPPAATLETVPAQFVGRWDMTVEDCATGGSPEAVSIGVKQIVFPDSALAVTGVSPDGARAARVDGHYTAHTGEAWDGSVRLEVNAGVLSVVSGSPVVPRVKCP